MHSNNMPNNIVITKMSTNDENNNAKRKSKRGESKGFAKSSQKIVENHVTAPQVIEITSNPTLNTAIASSFENTTTTMSSDDLILRTDLFKRFYTTTVFVICKKILFSVKERK